MEIILLESFDRLGKIGDVVKVKDGFARNFLLPKKKALRANKTNKEYFEKIKKSLEEKNSALIKDASKLSSDLKDKEIIFIRQASDTGQLYGSVSPKDISMYFKDKKIDISPSNINLPYAIKKLGIFSVKIKLHADVSFTTTINVAISEENAEEQKKELETKELKNKVFKKEKSLDSESSPEGLDSLKNNEEKSVEEEKSNPLQNKKIDSKGESDQASKTLEQKIKKENITKDKSKNSESEIKNLESKTKSTDTEN